MGVDEDDSAEIRFGLNSKSHDLYAVCIVFVLFVPFVPFVLFTLSLIHLKSGEFTR